MRKSWIWAVIYSGGSVLFGTLCGLSADAILQRLGADVWFRCAASFGAAFAGGMISAALFDLARGTRDA